MDKIGSLHGHAIRLSKKADAALNADELFSQLISSFWRGEFEPDGKSVLFYRDFDWTEMGQSGLVFAGLRERRPTSEGQSNGNKFVSFERGRPQSNQVEIDPGQATHDKRIYRKLLIEEFVYAGGNKHFPQLEIDVEYIQLAGELDDRLEEICEALSKINPKQWPPLARAHFRNFTITDTDFEHYENGDSPAKKGADPALHTGSRTIEKKGRPSKVDQLVPLIKRSMSSPDWRDHWSIKSKRRFFDDQNFSVDFSFSDKTFKRALEKVSRQSCQIIF